MNNKVLLYLITAGILLISGVVQAGTIPDFEDTSFYRGETLISKEKPMPASDGEVKYLYRFQDVSNPGAPYYFWLTTKQGNVIQIEVIWLGDAGSKPATLTSSRIGHLKQMAATLGDYKAASQLTLYVHAQEKIRPPTDVKTIPWKQVDTFYARAFREGKNFSVILRHAVPDDTPKVNLEAIAKIKRGTTSNQVLDLMGKPESIIRIGNDSQGLLAEWRYPGVIYTMGRRERDGTTEYRVIDIFRIGSPPVR